MTGVSNTASHAETVTEKNVYRPKIFIVFYSTYLHIYKLALAIKKGIEKENMCDVTLYQIAETLSLEVQTKIRAPPKPDVPIITPQLLREADGILFGFPTRYGTLPSQLKEFFDACGQLWATGGLSGKFSGAFVSTATQHGGQETSIFTLLTTLAHFGMMFVPLGYVTPLLNEDKVIMGGGPWGASMSAGKDGTRQPSEEELEIAHIQGVNFSKLLAQFHRNTDPVFSSTKILADESEKIEKKGTPIIPMEILAVVPTLVRAEELTELKNSEPAEADKILPEIVVSNKTTSFDDKNFNDTTIEKSTEKVSEVIAPLSASRALADFNIEEKEASIPPIGPSNEIAKSSPKPEIPPIDVAPELKPEKVASNDKGTESLIEMSVIDEIFNEARNTFPTEVSKIDTSIKKDKETIDAEDKDIINAEAKEISNAEDKEIIDSSDTKSVETSKDSKPKKAVIIASVVAAAAAGASSLIAKKIQDHSNKKDTNVSEEVKNSVIPETINEEKLNEVKESYFPPQENSLRVDNGSTAAPSLDTVKSPDVESRGISASNAFNKDDPSNKVEEVYPVPVVEAVDFEHTNESDLSASRKKNSLLELPLPATATEASGFKKKSLKSPSDGSLHPAEAEGESESEEVNANNSHEVSHKKSKSFARNSATNLRKFFKSLSIRGKPSDMP